MADLPPWLQPFLDRLTAEDLSAVTRRGYRYDLLQFVAWYTALYGTPPDLPRLTEHDVIAWRQHMLTLRQIQGGHGQPPSGSGPPAAALGRGQGHRRHQRRRGSQDGSPDPRSQTGRPDRRRGPWPAARRRREFPWPRPA